MDQDKEKNIEFIDKLKLFFVEQKIKIILIFLSLQIIFKLRQRAQ